MSIALMSMAWKAQLGAAQKLCLLAMCDWANDDGGSLHPSIKAISIRVGVTERHAKRIVHDLINDGWLYVTGNLFGGAPGAVRNYRINLKKLTETGDAHVTPTGDTHVTGDNMSRVTPMSETGDTHVTGGVTPMSETGDTHVTQPTIEPPKNHQGTAKGTRAHTRAQAHAPEQPLPDGLDMAAWKAWQQYRIDIRKPIKPASILAAQKSLAGFGANQPAVVEQSIANGWQGLFQLKAGSAVGAAKQQQQPDQRAKQCHCGAQGVVMRGGKWFCSEHEPKVVSIQPAKETRHVAAG